MMYKPVNVDDYVQHHKKFTALLQLVRGLLVDTELEETIKWNMPTYTIKGKNVMALGAFKNHACIWFHHGSFLSDPYKALGNAQDGKTRGMRQWRWEKLEDVEPEKVALYIDEAIQNEHQGKRIKVQKKKTEIEIHPLFAEALKKNKAEKAFQEFTKSKQRDFAEHITTAKRESTKLSRLDKIIPMILRGEGLNDKYLR